MATQELVVELDADFSDYTRKMAKAGANTKKTTDKMAAGFNRVEKSTKGATSGTKKFNLSTLAAAVSVALVTRKIVGYADSMTSITNKLKLATTSTENLNKVTNDLFKLSNDTRSSVTATVGLYTKLERSTRNLDISQGRLLKITGSINKAFAISGATTQEVSGSIRQLGQSLASGSLRGDEFNSIAEQAPIIMEAVSAATGKTAGELRKLAATGAITAKILIDSLERYSDKIDSDFAVSTATFAQKLEIAENNAIKFVGANKELNKIIDTTGDAIIGISNNLDVLIVAGEIAVVLFGSRLTASLTAATAKMVIAQIASLRAAGSFTAMGVAASVASKGMALLGGPVGVLVAVVSSLALFVDWETEAEKATKKANIAIDDQISSLKGLNAAQLELKNKEFQTQSINNAAAIKQVSEKIKEATAELEKLNQPLKGNSLLGGSQIILEKSRQKVSELKGELSGLFEEQGRIQKLGSAIFDLQLQPKLPTGGDKPLIDLTGGVKDKARSDAAEKQAEADEQELQAIKNRFKSEQDLLLEQFEIEKEFLELKVENKQILNETLLNLEDEFQDNLQAIKEKEIKAEEAIAAKKARLAAKEKKDKLDAIDATRKNLSLGMALNETFFNDNKAIKKGLIVADTAAAITRQFTDLPFPAALGTSAIIAATGLAQLRAVDSASKGGGSIGGGGGGGGSASASASSAPEAEESSSLDFTESGGGEANTTRIIIQDSEGNTFLDGIANGLEERQRQGR